MNIIKVKKLSDKAKLPVRSYEFDAGLDIFASESVFIPVGATVKISTDIAINIEPGYWGLICDRSSMGAKGLRTGAGVIDHGYTGHLCIVMHNLNNISNQDGYNIKVGDKIAQLVIQKVELPIVEEVIEMPITDRGSNSFGSSGR